MDRESARQGRHSRPGFDIWLQGTFCPRAANPQKAVAMQPLLQHENKAGFSKSPPTSQHDETAESNGDRRPTSHRAHLPPSAVLNCPLTQVALRTCSTAHPTTPSTHTRRGQQQPNWLQRDECRLDERTSATDCALPRRPASICRHPASNLTDRRIG